MHIFILYETQVGTTKFVAEVMSQHLTQLGHEVQLHSIRSNGKNPQFETADLLLVGSPTYYSGQLEPTLGAWIASAHVELKAKKCAVFSLGDKAYPEYCGSAPILEEWVTSHGGKLVNDSLLIDGYPTDTSPIIAWADEVAKKAGA